MQVEQTAGKTGLTGRTRSADEAGLRDKTCLTDKKVVVIDGQGGKMGKAVVEQLKKSCPNLPITAIGTNSIAVTAMMKAGADRGATGENPVLVACRDADLIIGPLGIVIADSLLGEITPAMAAAIGASSAHKLLIPVSQHCRHTVIGCADLSLSGYIRLLTEEVKAYLKL